MRDPKPSPKSRRPMGPAGVDGCKGMATPAPRDSSASADGRSSTEVLATLLEDRNLDAMLSVMAVRSGGDLRGVERSDLRAALIEVLGWEGIHA